MPPFAGVGVWYTFVAGHVLIGELTLENCRIAKSLAGPYQRIDTFVIPKDAGLRAIYSSSFYGMVFVGEVELLPALP